MAACLAAALVVAGAPRAAADVATYGGDGLRTGWYADQPQLAPSAVTAGDFGRVFETQLTGQIYAQPLVYGSTVFVATESNDIYGVDATSGAIKWRRNLHPTWKPADLGCADLTPEVGITGTPVIDASTGTAYFFAKTYASGTSGPGAWYMHAVDVGTGQERAGFPVGIAGTADNAPGTQFDATKELQRPGLLLLDGVVYAAFGGHCDSSPYQGWVVGVSTAGSIRAMWSTVDAASGQNGSGIWQSGGGLVSDRPGSIVFSTGNGTSLSAPTAGTAGPPTGYGEAVVRLNVQPDGSLGLGDFFMPYNADAMNGYDGDLGSGAPVALPPSSFGTATYPNLLVEVGKEGYVYLLDANQLGGYKQGANAGDAVLNRTGPDGGVWAKPTPWGGDGGWVYVPTASPGPSATGSAGKLHAYSYGLDGSGKPALTLAAESDDSFGFGSGSAVVTSDGTTTGSAVVWTVWMSAAGDTGAQLRAYSPVPVNGKMQLLRAFSIGGPMAKFVVPAPSEGRIYLGTRDGKLQAYGRPVSSALYATTPTFPPTVVGSSSTVNVTFTAQQATSVSAASTTAGAFSVAGPMSPPAGTPLSPGSTVTVPVAFQPTKVGPASGTLTLSTPQGIATAALSGSGRSSTPLLSAAPTAISFGGLPTGTTRTAGVTLTNDGAQAVTIQSVTPPTAPFGATGVPAAGTTIAPGDSVTVSVSFSPTAPGDYTDSLTVSSNGGDIAVNLAGSAGAPPVLQVTPTSIQLPSTPVGGWAETSFTITNAGGSDLTITKSKPPSGGAFTALTSLPEGSRLAAGQTVTERVRFAPTTAGPQQGTWDLNGDGSSSAVKVVISGDAPANAGVPPPTAGGWVLNGAASQQGALTVLTPNTANVAGTAIWPTPIDPTQLQASFDVTIDQGSGADGMAFALLPPGTDPKRVGGGGNGLGWGSLGGLAVTFDTYQNPGDPSANFMAVARWTGNAVANDGVATAIPPLRGTTRKVAVSIASGRVKVAIDGTQVLDVAETIPASALVAFTGATGGLTDRHAVSNVAVSTARLAVDRSAAAFGTTTTGSTTTTSVVLRNDGASALRITGATPPAAPFGATLPPNGTTIAPQATLTVPIRFTPTAPVASAGSLSIASDAGSVTVNLTGTGQLGTPTPPDSSWYLRGTPTAGPPDIAFSFGTPAYQLVRGHFAGRGLPEGVGAYVDGTWYLRTSPTAGAPQTTISYGYRGAVPVVGDWNGDGVDTIGVYDNGWWYLRNSNTPGPPDIVVQYGTSGYTPVVGDWDGDGIDTIGVYVGGSWYLRDSLTPGAPDRAFAFGTAGYVPVVGDWDGGTGPDGVGVFVDGVWYLRMTPTPGPPERSVTYGARGYRPVPGDWSGTGIDGLGVIVG